MMTDNALKPQQRGTTSHSMAAISTSGVEPTREPGWGGPRLLQAVVAPWRAICFLIGVIALTWAYATSPTSLQGLSAYTAICVGSTTAILWGVRRYRPTVKVAWYLVAGAPLLSALGLVLRQQIGLTSSVLVGLIPDIVTIPAYLLFAAGLLRFLRARRGADAGSAFDGGLMAVAALLVSWSTLISPVLNNVESSVTSKFVNGAYPTLSVAILFVGALLAMTEVTRIPAFWALVLAWVGLITGDLVYSLFFVGEATLPLWVANTAYCGFFGLLGVAGLLPSMVSLARPATKRVRGYGHSRFVAVAVALLVPAIVVAVRAPEDSTERFINAALLVILGVLVLLRTAWAVNRHATSEVRLELQANRDPLTGLPNRLRLASHLEEVLDRAQVAGAGVGVLFMDLDQFKNVNDSWGHETGDELLIVVAARLDSAVRRGELVARVGGDEFIIVCEGLDDVNGADNVAARMLTMFEDPVALRACDVVITSSVGIAFTKPSLREGVTAEDLIREADTAMYRSKARGGHSVVLFDESMRTEIAERIALESSLRGALERGELRMHYQPIVELLSGATTGFEALMRWKHPERGMIPPSDFIPVAEDTGLILKLGRWAIEEASSQLAQLALAVRHAAVDVGEPLAAPDA